MIGALVLLAAALLADAPAPRVVSLGGAITETVVALGAGERLVGVDDSSVFPAGAVAGLPRVGFHRTFSAEGVIALAPSVVLLGSDSGPPGAVAQLRAAGVATVVVVESDPSKDGALRRVRAIAAALGLEERGEALVGSMESDFAAAGELAGEGRAPRVLFVYAHGSRTVLVSGRGTAADAMIALAGGVNAISGFDGYRPLAPEAALAAEPDVILVTEAGLESVGGVERLLELPGLSLTPAGREKRVVAFDSLALLGFGPRAGRVAGELARALRERKASDERAAATR